MAHARIDERGPVITVTLTRPEKRNAIDEEITAALWEGVRALRDREP